MKKICICGGGALGHVAAGYIAARSKAEVRVLTNHPERWSRSISVHTPEGESLIGSLSMISSSAKDVVTGADVLLFCLPGFLIKEELEKVKPYLGNVSLYLDGALKNGFFNYRVFLRGVENLVSGAAFVGVPESAVHFTSRGIWTFRESVRLQVRVQYRR